MHIKQQTAFILLALLAMAATFPLSGSSNNFFQPYFGNISAPLVIGVSAVIGFFAARYLRRDNAFILFSSNNYPRGIIFSAGLATLFAFPVILADIFLTYPREINVPLPPAILFYPSIGYVAEISFHILPLAIIIYLLRLFLARLPLERLLWTSILFTSCIEPIFHTSFAISDGSLSWAERYTIPHTFAFGLAQLYVFRRFDFVAMYTMRLVYYLHWHILWGHARLDVLY